MAQAEDGLGVAGITQHLAVVEAAAQRPQVGRSHRRRRVVVLVDDVHLGSVTDEEVAAVRCFQIQSTPR